MERFDERDTIFSRMLLKKGSGEYRDYYSRHSDLESVDEALRSAPPGIYASMAEAQAYIDSTFHQIAQLRSQVHPRPAIEEPQGDPVVIHQMLQEQLKRMGALDIGACRSDESFFYSVRGRGESYGEPVVDYYPHCLVIAVEMDREQIARAPRPEASIEVVQAYLKAGTLAVNAANFLAQLGWKSMAHIDGESQIVLPKAAEMAGLGEIGFHGLLVHPRIGSRIRLAAVTTQFPLEYSSPTQMELKEFCQECRRCIKSCPAKAIEASGQPIDHEKCFANWKRLATDCGICLKVCPWENRENG